MSDNSDLSVSNTVATCEERRREAGRTDREYATSKRLEIWDRLTLSLRDARKIKSLPASLQEKWRI